MHKKKVNCNKITEIMEEGNANSIYTDSTTSCAYIQSLSNPLEILTIFIKVFYNF